MCPRLMHCVCLLICYSKLLLSLLRTRCLLYYCRCVSAPVKGGGSERRANPADVRPHLPGSFHHVHSGCGGGPAALPAAQGELLSSSAAPGARRYIICIL